MGGKKKKTVIGYKYFMGLHMGLCRGPVDAIRQIRVGGKVAWTGRASGNTTIAIDRPNLFGGEEQEGGIQGRLDVMMGAPDQPRNTRLAAMLGGLVSAFRGVTTTFFDGLVCAMSPYPKEWEYLVQKTKVGWYGGACWYPQTADMLMGTLDIDRDARVYIALDVSGSMSGTRLATLKLAMEQVIDALAALPVNVIVRLVAFSSTSSSIERYAGAGAGDLKAFVNGLVAAGGTLAAQAFGDLPAFFTGSDQVNVAVAVSDGDMTDVSTVASGFMAPWVAQTSTPTVEIRGVGIETRGSLQSFDNSGASVPVISGSSVSAAVTAIMAAINSASLSVFAMNPAHILRRLYTDPVIGRGLPDARLDETSWRAAADQFHAEGFGLCLKWSRTGSVADFAGEVLNHAGAVIYTSRRTGKIVLKAIRGDYDVDDLPLFTPDTGLLGFDDDQSAAQTTGINEIVVKYTDVAQKIEAAVREKNLGAILAADGVTLSEEVSYPGIPTEALARRVARRDLQAKSGFIKRFTVRLDRRGADIPPGGVFRITDAQRGISNLVLRAGRVEYGTATDAAVTITALQDVFGLPAAVYRAPEESGYQPPDTSIRPAMASAVFELPYRELVQAMSAADLAVMQPGAGYLHAAAVRPTTLSQSFDLLTRVAPADYGEAATMALFCPGGRLQDDIDALDTTVVLAQPTMLDALVIGTAAAIGAEIVRVDAVDLQTGELTIARGCADTVPQSHAAGTPMLCYDGWGADSTTEYTTGVSVTAQLLTNTGSGQLQPALAPELTCTFADRAWRPYPPADARINGRPQPLAQETGDLLITWAHRNRLTQADNLIDYSAASVAPESGTTYTVRVVNTATDDLLAEYTGITTATQLVSAAIFGGNVPVRITVTAWRDGVACWQSPAFEFLYVDAYVQLRFTDGYTPDDGDDVVLQFTQ